MESSLTISNSFRMIFLFFGVLSALLFATTDIIIGLIKPGSRCDTQSARVLSAFNTESGCVLILDLIAGLILIEFAVGIWFSAGQINALLRVMANLLAGNAIFSMIAGSFFPVDLNEPMNPVENKMNIILWFSSVVCFMMSICTGIFAYHN